MPKKKEIKENPNRKIYVEAKVATPFANVIAKKIEEEDSWTGKHDMGQNPPPMKTI